MFTVTRYLAVILVATAPAISLADPVHIAEGPILLHANIDQQWGGHTFSYLLEGPRCLFWSAKLFNADGKTWCGLVGQYPKPGSDTVPTTTSIPMSDPNIKSMNQPLMLRSDDGYIHMIIGVSHDIGVPNYNPGELRYFRSAKPDDISQLVDRTELIPHDPVCKDFHLRMNAGISRDGRRAAIVILAISKDGSVAWNTPVIFWGEKQGPDLVFQKPIKYADPMGFFYPQIALIDTGAVIVGQIWDNHDRSTTCLIQLDRDGKETHREDMPSASDGNYWCCDMRPITPDDWSQLVLYYCKYPKDRQDCRHEFWTYEPATATLKMRRSIPVPEGAINYGKWLPVSESRSLFIHNPSMGTFEAYDGKLLGEDEFSKIPLPLTNPGTYGYAGTAYTFVPNPFQGSVSTNGTAWFGCDYIPQKKDPNENVHGEMLLFMLNLKANCT